MAGRGFSIAHITEIPAALEAAPGEPEWKPVRRHFGIQAFGTNAYVARAGGDPVVEGHVEADDDGTGHEELYLVLSGRATFTVEGEDADAAAGTLVFVRDPRATRGAVAHEPGTTVIAFGATPGTAFEVSPFERKYE